MTIQTRVFDGHKVVTRTYRKVYKNVNFAKYVEGFFAQLDSNEWGQLIQLKGTERIVLRDFGKPE